MDRTTIHQEKVGWNVSSCQMCGVLSILASCGRKRHGAEQLSSCISRQSGDDRGDCQMVGSVTPHTHFFHQQRSRDLRSRVTQDSRSGAADCRATGRCREYRDIPEKYFQRESDKPPRTQTLPRPEALPLRAPHSLGAAGCPLRIKSSDATLHTVHMDGAAHYNLPFPFTNRVVARTMPTAGLSNVRCNCGHAWMNAEILVGPHPYYTVTDESRRFQLTDVPPAD